MVVAARQVALRGVGAGMWSIGSAAVGPLWRLLSGRNRAISVPETGDAYPQRSKRVIENKPRISLEITHRNPQAVEIATDALPHNSDYVNSWHETHEIVCSVNGLLECQRSGETRRKLSVPGQFRVADPSECRCQGFKPDRPAAGAW